MPDDTLTGARLLHITMDAIEPGIHRDIDDTPTARAEAPMEQARIRRVALRTIRAQAAAAGMTAETLHYTAVILSDGPTSSLRKTGALLRALAEVLVLRDE